MSEAHTAFLAADLGSFGSSLAAIDDQGGSITYAELAARADALGAGIGTARRLIVLEGGATIAWLVAYVAGLRGRHPMLIAPAGAQATIDHFTQLFSPGVLITAASGFRPELVDDGGAHPDLHPDLAVMLSTSGSTGSTKCVRLSLGNLTANAASIAEYLGLGPDERGAVNLPTHYSYGLSIVNSHLFAGGTLLLTGMSVIDKGFWPFMAEHGATSFAGVPHVYDLLGRIDFAGLAPKTLRYFTQAGGRLPPETATKVATLAATHGWRFFVMYGQTEATARIAYLPPERLLDAPGAIGVPVPGGRIELIGEDGAPVADGHDGEMVYYGPNVMMGYATGPADLALEPGPQRLSTGDIGQLGADGLLRITGRLSRFVKIFGNRIGLDDVERMIAEAGHQAIATGIDDQLLVVTRHEHAAGPIASLLTDALKLPPAYFAVRVVEEYPLLATGKIDYAGLKATIAPPTAPGATAEGGGDAAAGATSVEDAFVSVFGERARDGLASFNSLGGDSLNYVLVVMALERVLPTLPEDWETQSIDLLTDLAAGMPSGHDAQATGTPRKAGTATADLVKQLSMVDIARGLCMILVIAMHVDENHYSNFVEGGKIAYYWDVVTSAMRPVRMPLFFMVSGFIVSRAVFRPWREIAAGRVWFLLYLYVLWSLLRSMQELFAFGLVDHDYDPADRVYRFFSQLIYPNTALWFLAGLILYFLIARMTRHWPLWLSLGIAAIICGFSDIVLRTPDSFVIKNLLFYLLGAFVPRLIGDVYNYASWKATIGMGVIYSLSVGLILLAGMHFYGIWMPASFAGVALCLMFATQIEGTWLGHAFRYIGRRTLPIYLIHPLILNTLTIVGFGPRHAQFLELLSHPVFRATYPLMVYVMLVVPAILFYEVALKLRWNWLFELPNALSGGGGKMRAAATMQAV